MDVIVKNYGVVRDFTESINQRTRRWTGNPKARSILFENQGTSTVTLTSQNVTRNILPGNAYVLSGYSDSTRFVEFQINFTGAGTNNLLITQDVQIEEPELLIGGKKVKVGYCK